MPYRQNVVVFLTHSHTDRQVATTLQAVLNKYGARTYLDQDHIQAGDVLPQRITQGIADCDTLLLIWSMRSSRSGWVRREWETALELRKKIVPYALDATALPRELEDRVFVEPGDETRANAGLLRAVFGPGFAPDPTEVSPGRWQALVEIPMAGQAKYDLTLRANGQVEGAFRMLPSGIAGGLAEQLGVTSVLTTPRPVHGSWTYEGTADMLTLTITAQGYGISQTDTVHVRATGRERGDIQGTDLGGRLWTLSRSTESKPAAGASQPSSVRPQMASELQRQYELLNTLASGKKRAAEVVFIGTVGFVFQQLGVPSSELARLTGTPSILDALVTDELLDYLVQSGLLCK